MCVRWYRGVYRDGVREIIIIRWVVLCVDVRWYIGWMRIILLGVGFVCENGIGV